MDLPKAKALLGTILDKLEMRKLFFEFLSEGIGQNPERLNDHYTRVSTIVDRFYECFTSVPFDLADRDETEGGYEDAVHLVDSILYEMHFEQELLRMQEHKDEHNKILSQFVGSTAHPEDSQWIN